MAGDNVAPKPTLEDEMSKFKGFVAEDGETIDPETEDLNPVSTGLSAAEKKAGATVIEEKPVELETDEKGEKKPAAKAKVTADGKELEVKDAPVPPGVQKRINEAIRKQRIAERESAANAGEVRQLKERLERLESGALTRGKAGATDDADDDPNAPKPATYEYGELDPKFIRDLARYEAKKELAAEKKTQETQRKTAAQSSEQTELMEKAHAFEEAGLSDFDDFEEVVIEGARAGTWALTPTVGELILDSDVGHKVAYFLAQNPKEAAKVAKLKPLEQAKWFARKEDEVSAEAPAATDGKTQKQAGSERSAAQERSQAKVQSKAPPIPPNRARGGQGTTAVSADTTDFAAFESLMNGRTAH